MSKVPNEIWIIIIELITLLFYCFLTHCVLLYWLSIKDYLVYIYYIYMGIFQSIGFNSRRVRLSIKRWNPFKLVMLKSLLKLEVVTKK